MFDATQQREHLRWAWHGFFGKYDLLLMPITATAAFSHDQSEPLPARRMRINDAEHPYFAQLFWAGLATAPFLPSTVAPVGLTPDGLPVGVQSVSEFAEPQHDLAGRRTGEADRRLHAATRL